MNLTAKQIRKIKRLSETKTPEQIAKELNIPVKIIIEQTSADIAVEKSMLSFSGQDILNYLFLLLLCAYICIAPFYVKKGIYDFANLPQNIFIQLGVLILIIILFIKKFAQNGLKITLSHFHIPLFLFLIWSLITLFWAANRFEGIYTWMQWTGPYLAFLLFYHGIEEKNYCHFILFAVFISGLAVALLGIAQWVFGVDWVPQVAKPSATFANKNMAAHYAVLTIPLGIGLFLNSKSKIADWFFALSCALMTSFLIYTRARAAWLSFAAEVFLFSILLFAENVLSKKDLSGLTKVDILKKIIIRNHFKTIYQVIISIFKILFEKKKILPIFVGFCLFIFMIHFSATGFDWKFMINQYVRNINDLKAIFAIEKPKEVEEIIKIDNIDEKDKDKVNEIQPEARQKESSFAGRIAIWRNSWEMIKDYYWSGVGLGNHKVYYPLYFRKVIVERWFSEQFQLTNAHNDYVQTWSEVGTIGMFFLLWFFIAIVWIIYNLMRYEENMRFTIIGIAVSIGGLLVNAFASFPFQRALPPLLLMIYVAVIAILYRHQKNHKSITIPPMALIFLAVFTFVGLNQLYKLEKDWLACDRYYLRITSAEKAKIWNGVIREAKTAIALNPHRRKILSYMGRAYIESGNPKEGIEALKKVIEVYPYHMNAMLNLGVAYGNINDFDNALATYERVINIKPDYAKVHNNIANIYMKQKKLDDALNEFRLAAQFDPENAVIHFNVGIVALNKKFYEEARDAFQKTIEIRPGWAMAHKNLGVVLYQYLKKRKEGAKHFQEALKFDPKMKDAEQMKKIIQSVFENPPKNAGP